MALTSLTPLNSLTSITGESLVYKKQKKACQEAGMLFRFILLPGQ